MGIRPAREAAPVRLPVLATALLAMLSGCDSTTSIEGTVRGPDGQPLSCAFTTMDFAKDVTGPDGRYDLFNIHGTDLKWVSFAVEKPGFVSFERRFRAGETHMFDLTLDSLAVEPPPEPCG